MVILVRAEAGPSGLEVVKQASTEADRHRLAREAAQLRTAAHPGVVEVVAAEAGELRLRHHGSPLARLLPVPADHSASILRAVGETVADLHELGLAHGRIDADHVVVDGRGRPRLCGFAAAGDATEEARAADVADLGRLLDQLLDTGGALPWSQLKGWRRRTRRRHGLRRLRAAASAARSAEPCRRPTARQLSAMVRDAVPAVTLPAGDDPEVAELAGRTRGRQRRSGAADHGGWTDEDLALLAEALDDDEVLWRRESPRVGNPGGPAGSAVPSPSETGEPARRADRRLLAVVAGLVLVTGIVVGSTTARALRPFGASSLDEAAPPLTDPTIGRGVDDDPRPRGCPRSGPTGPDVDGDGCPDPLTLEDRIASLGGVRIELGRPGDLAVVADSDCDGIATPVLLRPSTGEVFVFDAWSIGETVEVSASEVVPGAAAIGTDAAPCPAVVVTGEGVRHVVEGAPG